MERSSLSSEQYTSLLESVFNLILDKGLSHTSMDFIASCLGMSKRTLYELFGSKDELLLEVFEYQHNLHKQNCDRIFSSTTNAMEGLAKVIAYQQQFFRKANSVFFRDMDERFKHLRHDFDGHNHRLAEGLGIVIDTGIAQGVFRPGIDYQLQLTLLRVQMESLKRMEEFFPPGISLQQAYTAITQGFLRSIATTKGIEILETLGSAPDQEHK